jgi:hypothetical protein
MLPSDHPDQPLITSDRFFWAISLCFSSLIKVIRVIRVV